MVSIENPCQEKNGATTKDELKDNKDVTDRENNNTNNINKLAKHRKEFFPFVNPVGKSEPSIPNKKSSKINPAFSPSANKAISPMSSAGNTKRIPFARAILTPPLPIKIADDTNALTTIAVTNNAVINNRKKLITNELSLFAISS